MVLDPVRVIWGDLAYLRGMDNERLLGLGLEPVLTTSELADYLGVHAQAIYELRTDGRGPIEHSLRQQRAKLYTRAKHSRTILNMILAFAVRREIIPRNPMKETSRMKKPPHTPKALTADQIAAIRLVAREWRAE